jgi:hypothetical protein
MFEERNCGERAKDGRGLVTAAAVGWEFYRGEGSAGTEPPDSLTAAIWGGSLGGGDGWGRAINGVLLTWQLFGMGFLGLMWVPELL